MTRRSMGNRLITGGWNAGNHYHYRDDRALATRDAQREIADQTAATILLPGPKPKHRRTRAQCRAQGRYRRDDRSYGYQRYLANGQRPAGPGCHRVTSSSGFRRVSPRKVAR